MSVLFRHLFVQLPGSFKLQFSVLFLEPFHVTTVEILWFIILSVLASVSFLWTKTVSLPLAFLLLELFYIIIPLVNLFLVSEMDWRDIFQFVDSTGIVGKRWCERMIFFKFFFDIIFVTFNCLHFLSLFLVYPV